MYKILLASYKRLVVNNFVHTARNSICRIFYVQRFLMNLRFILSMIFIITKTHYCRLCEKKSCGKTTTTPIPCVTVLRFFVDLTYVVVLRKKILFIFLVWKIHKFIYQYTINETLKKRMYIYFNMEFFTIGKVKKNIDV